MRTYTLAVVFFVFEISVNLINVQLKHVHYQFSICVRPIAFFLSILFVVSTRNNSYEWRIHFGMRYEGRGSCSGLI